MMTMFKKLVAASAGALIVFQSLAASAAGVDAMMWVSGPKTGELDGKAPRDRTAATVVDFIHGPTKPGDLKTGLASGKRIHEPIVVTMRLDKATAQLFQAALGKPDKLQVKFAFYRPAVGALTGAGEQKPYYTLSLGDAMVEKVEVVPSDKVQDTGDKTASAYLRVQFTFQKIEWTWATGATTAADDWFAPN